MTFAVSGDALRPLHGPLLAAPRAAARRLRRIAPPARAPRRGLRRRGPHRRAGVAPGTFRGGCRRPVPHRSSRRVDGVSPPRRPLWRRPSRFPGEDASFDAALAQLVVNFIDYRRPMVGRRCAASSAKASGRRLHSGIWLGGMRMLAHSSGTRPRSRRERPRRGEGEALSEAPRSSTRSGARPASTTWRPHSLDVAVEYEDFDDFWLLVRERDRAGRRISRIARSPARECSFAMSASTVSASRAARSRWPPVPGPRAGNVSDPGVSASTPSRRERRARARRRRRRAHRHLELALDELDVAARRLRQLVARGRRRAAPASRGASRTGSAAWKSLWCAGKCACSEPSRCR